MEAGKFQPMIDRTYPLSTTADAWSGGAQLWWTPLLALGVRRDPHLEAAAGSVVAHVDVPAVGLYDFADDG